MAFRFVTAPVLEHRPMAAGTYLVRLECPEIAAAIRPGQFVMLRLPGTQDPLLGRPFALYDTVLDSAGKPIGIDVVYLVVGKMTGRLTSVSNEGGQLEVWGPLGNGFPDPQTDDHVGLVAGGIGQTPFLAHIRDLNGLRGYGGQRPRKKARRVSLYYGVRTAQFVAGYDDFRAAGAEVHLASDDGSIGERGFVTDMLARGPMPGHLFGCGPEPMLHALAKLAAERGVPCHVSLETPMACGVGICFSCVTPVRRGDGWDYSRVCIDGPVFDACSLHHG
jgi:dihydroorotate dehydrogenase electron transfer subunit